MGAANPPPSNGRLARNGGGSFYSAVTKSPPGRLGGLCQARICDVLPWPQANNALLSCHSSAPGRNYLIEWDTIGVEYSRLYPFLCLIDRFHDHLRLWNFVNEGFIEMGDGLIGGQKNLFNCFARFRIKIRWDQ